MKTVPYAGIRIVAGALAAAWCAYVFVTERGALSDLAGIVFFAAGWVVARRFGRPVGLSGARPWLDTVLPIALAAFAGPITAGRPWERLGAVVSIWAVLNGLLDMAIGAGVFGGARRRWQVVMGAVSVVLGASLLAWPPGMIALTLWIVLFSALYGAVTIVEASRGVRVE